MQLVVLIAVIMKIIVFLDMIPCNLPPSSGQWGQTVLGETMVVIYLITRRQSSSDKDMLAKRNSAWEKTCSCA